MVHVKFSCGCSSWLIRSITWATITAGFILSIIALQSCELIEGRAIYYDIPDEDIDPNDLPLENGTRPPLPEPKDPFFDPIREVPIQNNIRRFTLGPFSANGNDGYGCLPYKNGFTQEFWDAGATELIARLFGGLAAALGGISMIVFFAMAATEIKKKCTLLIFAGILVAAAIFQALIFVLHASNHCNNQYWNDFLSIRDQNLEQTAAVSCGIGDDGWLAIVAMILYLFAAGMVALKWYTPSFSVFNMEWTKDYNDNGGSDAGNTMQEKAAFMAGDRYDEEP